MKTSGFTLLMAAGGISLLLSACAESPATPQSGQQAAAQAPVEKTCQTDYATGSHYDRRTVCQTEEEQNQTEQDTNQALSTYRELTARSKKSPGRGGG